MPDDAKPMSPKAAAAARRQARKDRQREALMSGLLQQLRDDADGVRAAGSAGDREKLKREDWRDGDYYCVVAFQSRAQKLAAMQAMGLDVEDSLYVSGEELIQKLGLDVPIVPHKRHRLGKNQPWLEFAEPVPRKRD